MFSDAARLTYSINPKRVTIMDNITQKMFVKNNNTPAERSDLDKDTVYNHLQLLMRSLVGKKVTWIMYKPFTTSKGITTTKIMEYENNYNFIVDGKCAELKGDVLYGERGFDVNKLLQDVNYAYSLLCNENVMLRPKTDVMRLVADADIYILKYLSNVMVFPTSAVKGNYIRDVIFNDEYFSNVTYTIEEDLKTVEFLNNEGIRLLTCPYDFSVKTFLKENKSVADAILDELDEQ